MKATPTLPYLPAPADAIAAGRWMTGSEGDDIGPSIDHWDPALDLSAVRAFHLDLARVRDAARLASDASLALVSSWRSAPARTAGVGQIIELGTLADAVDVETSMTVPGAQLAGTVRLRSALILRTPGAEGSPVAAKLPGSVLWGDEFAVRLEGGSGRFPVTVLDFSATTFDTRAGWVLEVEYDDLSDPFLGAVRLLLNSAHTEIVRAVSTGESPVVIAMLQADIARVLIHRAVADDDFLVHPDGWPDESVGRAFSELLASVWPHRSPTQIRALHDDQPGVFDARVQGSQFGGSS